MRGIPKSSIKTKIHFTTSHQLIPTHTYPSRSLRAAQEDTAEVASDVYQASLKEEGRGGGVEMHGKGRF